MRVSDLPLQIESETSKLYDDNLASIETVTRRLSQTAIDEKVKNMLARADETIGKSSEKSKRVGKAVNIKTMVFASEEGEDVQMIPADKRERVDKMLKASEKSSISAKKPPTGVRNNIRNTVLGNDTTESAPLSDNIQSKLVRADKVLSRESLLSLQPKSTGRRISIMSVLRGRGSKENLNDQSPRLSASVTPEPKTSSEKETQPPVGLAKKRRSTIKGSIM